MIQRNINDDATLAYLFKRVWDAVYPVGSIYMSANSTSPERLFGGKWERITGRFLLAATDGGAAGGNSNASIAPGNTGGEATHRLSLSEIPSHEGHIPGNTSATFESAGEDTYYIPVGSVAKYSTTRPYVLRAGNEIAIRAISRGGDGSHNNMPPYLAVYVWKRTA